MCATKKSISYQKAVARPINAQHQFLHTSLQAAEKLLKMCSSPIFLCLTLFFTLSNIPGCFTSREVPTNIAPVVLPAEAATDGCPSDAMLGADRNATKQNILQLLSDTVNPYFDEKELMRSRGPCGGPGRWDQVAYLNASDPDFECLHTTQHQCADRIPPHTHTRARTHTHAHTPKAILLSQLNHHWLNGGISLGYMSVCQLPLVISVFFSFQPCTCTNLEYW